MNELIEVLKTLSHDMHKGDTALFNLCEKMINQICAQEKQILALLENQKLIAEVIDKMSESVEVQSDTIKTHNRLMTIMRETMEAYTKKTVN